MNCANIFLKKYTFFVLINIFLYFCSVKRIIVCWFVVWVGVVSLSAELLSGELSGDFSVGASAYVHFSKGNLIYFTNSWSWKFSDNQYDYIGFANVKVPVLGSKIDLFGYSSQPDKGTPEYGALVSNSDDSYKGAFVDWGHNGIANGGEEEDVWSTLSKGDWNYLLTQRANASKLQKIVTVGTVKGLLLLPDNATVTIVDSYTTDEFNSLATNSGAVFLPMSGYRNGTTVSDVNTQGGYWTSSTESETKAYQLKLSDSSASIVETPRHMGYTVRLVRQYVTCKKEVTVESNNPDWGTCSIIIE